MASSLAKPTGSTTGLCSSDAIVAPSVEENQQKCGRGVFDGRSQKLTLGDLVLVLNEKTPVGLWAIGTVLEVREGPDGQSRKFRLRIGKRLDVVRSASSIAPISLGSTLPNDRLLHDPPLLRPLNLQRKFDLERDARRTRAQEVLASRAAYEEAKRTYVLYTTGKAPAWGRKPKNYSKTRFIKNLRPEVCSPAPRSGRRTQSL